MPRLTSPRILTAAAAVLAAIACASPAPAQCDMTWFPEFPTDDPATLIACGAVFDDGQGGGPALYIIRDGGLFRWTGTTWEQLADGTEYGIGQLIVFDADGPGAAPPALYAIGRLISRWQPEGEWTTVATIGCCQVQPFLRAAVVHDDDGPGPIPPALYIAGRFNSIDGAATGNIARWDGQNWSTLDGGLSPSHSLVSGLASFDPDADGPAAPLLVAGGDFTGAGGVTVSNLAAWNGSQWLSIGHADARIWSLLSWDPDGPGAQLPQLIAGGQFTSIGGVAAQRIARWNGLAWGPIGAGASSDVLALAQWDADGPAGPDPALLVAGGTFSSMGGAQARLIAMWDGASWSEPDRGITNAPRLSSPFCNLIIAADDAIAGLAGPTLVACGRFLTAGGIEAKDIAAYDGALWSRFGVHAGPNGGVTAITDFDPDGVPPAGGPLPAALIIAGHFTTVAGVPAVGVARRTGSTWAPLGSGIPLAPSTETITAMTVYDDDGPGPRPRSLYVAGKFPAAGGVPVGNIARWDGEAWSPLGPGVDGQIDDLLVWDPDGPGPIPESLYASAARLVNNAYEGFITRWDGAQWQAVGPTANNRIYSIIAFDPDGPVPESLYALGDFTAIGATPIANAARWTGAAWDSLPPPPSLFGRPAAFWPRDSVIFDADGAAGPQLPKLVVSAYLYLADQQPNLFYVFDGATWSNLHIDYHEMHDPAWCRLAVHDDDGPGPLPPALYAFGELQLASIGLIAGAGRWSGSEWNPLGEGLGLDPLYYYSAIHSHDPDGPAEAGGGPALPRLYLASDFTYAGGDRVAGLAVWGAAPDIVVTQHPASLAVRSGQTAVLTALADAPSDVSYQWRRRGVPLTDGGPFSGVLSPTLTISPALPIHAGDYDVHLTSGCGDATTDPATLTITCAADWTGDGPVNSTDISAYLTAWLDSIQTGTLDADFNTDDAVNSIDISAFLTAWLAAVQTGC